MAWDDPVDAGDAGGRFGQGLAELGCAAVAAGDVEIRQPLAGHHVARMHHPRVAEHDKRVAVGVTTPEVVQVDAVGTAVHRHPVAEGLVR